MHANADSDQPGVFLGPFRLDGPVGRGAMAEVWRGVHVPSHTPVAVKVVLGGRTRSGRHRELFRNEVRAMASLDHPAIVRVFDHGDVSEAAEAASRGRLLRGSPALAMELTEHGTLDAAMDDVLDGGWPRLRQTLLDLLAALSHAHARGVVHRDLKPNNVLRFSDGRFKLADFGLAYALDVENRETGREGACGTPHYMAPEQVTGDARDFGPSTDLYALGCVAHELICGRPPFPYEGVVAVARAHLLEEPVIPPPRLGVPAGLDAWLLRLLEKDPAHRFVLAADAAHALRALGEAPATRPAGPRPEREQQPTLLSGTLVTQTLVHARPQTPPSARPAAVREPAPTPPFVPHWDEVGTVAGSPLAGAGLGLVGLRAVPLAGRHAERDALWQTLAEVVVGAQPSLVVLSGAGGSGKSRLARWLCERCHEIGVATDLRLTHGPVAGPADGLPRALDRFFVTHGLSSDEVLARVGRWLSLHRHVGAEPPAADVLTRVIRPHADAGPGPHERNQAVGALLATMTRTRPLVLWVDDAQWGSDALACIDHLLGLRMPLLVLVTVRDEVLAERELERGQLDALMRHPRSRRIPVAPLSAADRRQLLRDLLRLETALAERVERRGHGNPLFMIELVGSWVERGLLMDGPDGYRLADDEHADIPDQLHTLWTRRIERALVGQPAHARAALERAAALGICVDHEEWVRACETTGLAFTPDLIDRLVEHALVDRGDGDWCFRHPMLRESLERLAVEAGRWSEHHAACVRMLDAQRIAGPGQRGVAERIGEHALAAGMVAEALDPLLEGARERRESSDYRRARCLIDERERALHRIGGDPIAVARGRILRARIALHEGELAEVERFAETAQRLCLEHGALVEHTEALRLLGDAARRRGHLGQASRWYEAAIELAPRVDHPHGVAASLWGLGDVLRQRGDCERARELFSHSSRLYEQIEDQHGVADELIGLGDIARQQHALVQARELYGLARSRFAALANRYGVARATNGLGECARLGGQLALSVPLYRGAMRTLESIGSTDAVFPRINLALAHLASGEPYAARELLEPTLARLAPRGWTIALGCAQAGMALCSAEQGELEAALGWIEQLRSEVDPDLFEVDLAWCAEATGDRAAAAGRRSVARVAYELACAQLRGLGRPLAARRLAVALTRL